MAAACTMVSRQFASSIGRSIPYRITNSTKPLIFVHRRGVASTPEQHGVPKVNFWEAPMSPSKWKNDQFVLVTLAGSGLAAYGAYKYYIEGKYDDKSEKVGDRLH